jgi:phosphotransferase system enzyme I (PtsI)
MPDGARSGERTFRGIPVSPGVCRGKILVLGLARDEISRVNIPEEEVPNEIVRLQQALLDTRQQILEVQRQVTEGLGAHDGSIFDAHLLVLEDPTLIDEVTRLITQEKVSAEYAFKQVAENMSAP